MGILGAAGLDATSGWLRDLIALSVIVVSMRSRFPVLTTLKQQARRLVSLPRPVFVRMVQRLRGFCLRASDADAVWAEVKDPRYEDALPIDLQGESAGSVRILAFFLPQFHRDEVNEKAWGRGFTEWMNVSKAKPLFDGHQQPKLPADLGFYNLATDLAWREQQQITSQYGIDGFVLYHYWFGGVCPLETALLTLLNNPDIDQKFCLCWANESWTRRWDGGNQEVILEQSYDGESPEELADYLLQFFRDSRYITEQAKPVYLIYRPEDLVDAPVFLARLRARLRENGFEISLGRVLSFRANPQDVLSEHFDFAVQFPVHGSYGQLHTCLAATPLRGVRDPLQLTQTNLLNYQAWAKEQARCYQYLVAESDGGIPVFPAVMPDFDNTARRGNRGGSLFINQRAGAFAEWVQAVVRVVQRINFVNQKRFIRQPYLFVCSWNEWAEGSVMEPSLQLGYHYLNELYRSCVATDIERQEMLQASRIGFHARSKDALVYHLYYPELVDEAVCVLGQLSSCFDVFLSVSSLISAQHLRRLVGACSGNVVISEFPNYGYDIYPFLRYVSDDNLDLLGRYRWILKLHSKRSTHRPDGAAWSEALREQLCGLDLDRIQPEIGFVMPEMSTLKVSDFVGSNRQQMKTMMQLLGVDASLLETSHFAAGSMYLIRTQCLQPFREQLPRLLSLLAQEGYRVDGSYAHALERCMQFMAYRAGYHLCSSRSLSHCSDVQSLAQR